MRGGREGGELSVAAEAWSLAGAGVGSGLEDLFAGAGLVAAFGEEEGTCEGRLFLRAWRRLAPPLKEGTGEWRGLREGSSRRWLRSPHLNLLLWLLLQRGGRVLDHSSASLFPSAAGEKAICAWDALPAYSGTFLWIEPPGLCLAVVVVVEQSETEVEIKRMRN